MSGAIINDPPGRIDSIGSGWTVELDAMPHIATDGSGSTGVVNFTAPADSTVRLVMNNRSRFVFADADALVMPDVTIGGSTPGQSSGDQTGGGNPAYGEAAFGDVFYGGTNPALAPGYNRSGYGVGGYNSGAVVPDATLDVGTPGQVYQSPGELAVTAYIDGMIDSLSVQGGTASVTQGTGLTQFATGDLDVPGVTSGSPLAAFNVAWQLAGNRACTMQRAGEYWSLRGHDLGVDAKNKPLTPKDNTSYKVGSDAKTLFRRWDVQHSFTSLGWTVVDGEFWSTAGIGGSVLVQASHRTAVVGTVNLDGRSFTLQFGASTAPDFIGFGPDDARNGTGKWFTVGLHGPTASATLNGQYRAGGAYETVSKAAALSGIDMTSPVQFVADIGYPSPSQFSLTVYVQNVDSPNPPVVISTGLINGPIDAFAAPWKSAGLLHGVYVTTGSYHDFDPEDLLGPYEDWTAQPLCNLDQFGLDTPILPFTGSLWDYLTQVCTARQVGLRLLSGRYSMAAMTQDSLRAQPWHPAASPTYAIDNSSTAATIEVDGQFASFSAGPRIYDALDKNESYSLTPGTTAQFTISTTTINSLVYNPEPVEDVDAFLDGTHPYGAYIVSSATKHIILKNEWITYGGSVSVEQTGANTLTVTVVVPDIPLPDGGSDSDYSFAIADVNNSYPMLRLSSVAGGQVVDHKVVFQTGASFVAGNTAGATVSNVAATNHQALQNVAAWAVARAAGPNITLSGEFPLDDLRRWESSDFGMVPGSTLLYDNVQWRIMTATMSNIGVAFTAIPYVTYDSTYFDFNWAGFTVDDYALFWEGRTYDDMATMPLAGPNFDWDNRGAVARYSLYPGGGSGDALDLGLEADPLLLPDPLLEPDAPGVQVVGALFPDATDFPGAATFMETRVIGGNDSGGVFPAGPSLFPGGEEDQ